LFDNFSLRRAGTKLCLNTSAKAQVWVDGVKANVREGTVRVDNPPIGVATVAVHLEMEPGAYAEAAFTMPIVMSLQGGKIKAGE